MKSRNLKRVGLLIIAFFFVSNVNAESIPLVQKNRPDTIDLSVRRAKRNATDSVANKRAGRLTFGGYGEATYKYSFYSDNAFRYSFADRYANSKGFGQVDIPHVVLMLGYDFGKGWSMGTEIEFEHGGTEVAVEIESEETGEYEQEIERGGEVALEQFWLQKSFLDNKLNIRLGHIVVPVGATNSHHLPTEFFNVFRPEGENTIIPCTWHETGISVWGQVGGWRYEFQLLPALNSTMFNVQGWAHDASASPYEFRVANKIAGAFRVDNTSVNGLRLSLSGYVGNTFNNDIVTEENSTTYKDVKGTVVYGSFDFQYKHKWLVLRGNYDYGYLGDAALISRYNNYLPNSSSAPYPHTLVGRSVMDGAFEAGFNLLPERKERKLYLFARYEYYDSYNPAYVISNGERVPLSDFKWTERHVFSAGLNYYPIPYIAIKGEFGYRMLAKQYNSEPWVAVGICYSAFFKR
ncbi:MAG: hypothetical protein II899_12135 [Bacteroidales bacterium]|nr:hypothetical protein [Bacteroidales bacterium]